MTPKQRSAHLNAQRSRLKGRRMLRARLVMYGLSEIWRKHAPVLAANITSYDRHLAALIRNGPRLGVIRGWRTEDNWLLDGTGLS